MKVTVALAVLWEVLVGEGEGMGVKFKNSEIVLAAACYRNKPDITTVLKGRLICMQALKIFHIYNRGSHFA